MLTVCDLTLSYRGRAILGGLNFSITPGECVAVIGESGVGKSTLLAHLREQYAERIAWCPQQGNLVSVLSAFHNIYAGTLDQHHFLYNLRQLISPSRKEVTKVAAVAEPLGIEQLLGKSLDQLSGGQQQRVNIARALIQQRPVFIGDEPVSALDEFQRPQVLKHITAQSETCIFALHDLDLALACCDRIIGLGSGGVVIDCRVNEVNHHHLAQLFRHHHHHLSL